MFAMAMFNRFTLELTHDQAMATSAPGQDASNAVEWVLTDPRVVAQLDDIGYESLKDELTEYGAWDEDELTDDDANRRRIVWLAGCDIREEERRNRD